ncbi:related to monooxygenase [Rhynchosporium graminicola]|uniref:Related to monooxygenase n=1 Tax=Rhynchosporium graminicola TaxID=2792576 RepID=A0A1E1KJY6_9HELO|nr:related to monooxygenase [Rhynchosporium commune]
MPLKHSQVIIVGAGPSGLVLSLLLAKVPSIRVTLIDAASQVDDRPRAAHYAPSAIRVLASAGVLPDIRDRGLIPGNMTWRNIKGEAITSIKNVSQHPYNPEALTVLPLGMLGKLLLEHVARQSNIEVRWNAKVVDVIDGDKKVQAVIDRGAKHGGNEQVEGDYLVGCDGATSRVRRTLFGSSFPGKTWDAQIVATNVYYPFEKFGYDDVNFVIDPVDYYLAAKLTTDGLWRVSYGEDTSLTPEQVIAHQPAKYERMLPGNPKPGSYKLMNVGPYRIHQRCAPSFRVGRVLLAADAAHLCNPFGGLGLTGGLVDVGGLAQCLEGIARGFAGDGVLDLYSSVRRNIWATIIDPISSENFLRVSATDPEKALTDDSFLVMVDEAGKDAEKRRILDEGAYDICHDFRQYWKEGYLEVGQKEAKL